MKMKFVRGVTLTPQERAMAGLTSAERPSSVPTLPSPSDLVKSHCGTVLLPDGASCPVVYTRSGSRAHLFEFREPLLLRFWIPERLENTREAIEQKAQSLAAQAFRQAQEREQKEMRRASCRKEAKPKETVLPPQLRPQTAARCAGMYTVCRRFASGSLLPVAALYEQPESAVRALEEMRRKIKPCQRGLLTVGICNRLTRRWVEPQFLPSLAFLRGEEPVADQEPPPPS